MIEFTRPIHRTNILPLRWFANSCNHLASRFLQQAVYLDYISEDGNKPLGFKYTYNMFMYNFINKPYRVWGTTYELDMDSWRKDTWGDKNVD